MDNFIRDTLKKQMQILSERSVRENGEYLAPITEQMIALAKCLEPELRSQSYVEMLSRLPSATLTMSDLEEITSARKEKLRKADDSFRQFWNELQKTTPNPPPESDGIPSNQ